MPISESTGFDAGPRMTSRPVERSGAIPVARGVCIVSVLYELKVKIEEKIKADGLDAAQVRGEIGLRTGRLLALISPSTADDPVVVATFRQAAHDLLKIRL
jgi:hypothetical protein